ncbi:MAG: hypothetical protein MI863_24335, partial [Desulfobacterales bacterium]|nr:hypothetical protein [Desulfobacterales bacterium]
EVDGMTLYFYEGTLAQGDVFYVSTDNTGTPAEPDTLSDWHWTQQSFADEFNRSAGGVTASVSGDNCLVFDLTPDYCSIENIEYSGSNGFTPENTTVEVKDYTAFDTPAQDMTFARQDGEWVIVNDPTGGTARIIPEGGSDDGFEVDLDGDGFADMEVAFDEPVTGDGYVRMDLESSESGDIQYAFAGSEDGDCGLAAAAGINTFFTGTGAADMGVNPLVADGRYLATGMVDKETFTTAPGDNSNAMAMADTRYDPLAMKTYDYTRGEPPRATVTETTLNEYEQTMVGSIGFTTRTTESQLEYADLMVYQLTAQRDAISAVSLDEEMIKLTQQQQAYLAAAELLRTVDEMFQALLAIR